MTLSNSNDSRTVAELYVSVFWGLFDAIVLERMDSDCG